MKIGAYEFKAPDLSQYNYHYVYFDIETGDVLKISNELTEEDVKVSYLTEVYEDVRKILEGKKPLRSQKVIFDTETRQYKLKDKLSDEFIESDFRIYELPYKEKADISVVEDVKNTCWKFLIDGDFKSSLINNGVMLRMTLSFSVTEKHNPNILYKTLHIPFEQLFRQNYYILPFTSNFEFDGKEISVYTMKQFDSYSFEVINE